MKFKPKALKHSQDISRGKQSWHEHAQFLLTVTLVLGGGYLLLGVIADQIALRIPNSWEQSLFKGESLASPEKATHPRFESAKNIFERLTKDPQVRKLEYRLIEMSTPEPNAFAAPGGLVGVTPGLLEVTTSETGLAMVLAHELGHHTHRHTLKHLGRGLLNAIALSILSLDQMWQDLAGVVDRRYSQRQEREADEFGLRLIQRNYGTTHGALEFFEWAEGEETKSQRLTGWLNTHPLSADRIEHLKTLARSLKDSNRH